MANSKCSSNIWAYFTKCVDNELIAQCLLCDQNSSCRYIVRGNTLRNCSTTPLWNHIRIRHTNTTKEDLMKNAKNITELITNDLGRDKINPVYKYFRYDGLKNTSKCLIDECKAILTSNHAANLGRHIKRFHQQVFELLNIDVSSSIPQEEVPDLDIAPTIESFESVASQASSFYLQTSNPIDMSGPYLLKKETHCNSILDDLLNDNTFTDVTLTAEGQHIKAHKVILCLSSKYFKEVLSEESSAKNAIFFRDIKFQELKNMISFIYTGEVTVDAEDLDSFMKTAELLEITSLCEGQKNFTKGLPISKIETKEISSRPKKRRSCPISLQGSALKKKKTSTKVASSCLIRESNVLPSSSDSFTVIKDEVLSDPEIDDGNEWMDMNNPFVDVGQMSGDEILSPTQLKEELVLVNEKVSDSLHSSDDSILPGRCPFCPETQPLDASPTLLTHLQVSHPENLAYPCENCFVIYTNKVGFQNHHKVLRKFFSKPFEE